MGSLTIWDIKMDEDRSDHKLTETFVARFNTNAFYGQWAICSLHPLLLICVCSCGADNAHFLKGVSVVNQREMLEQGPPLHGIPITPHQIFLPLLMTIRFWLQISERLQQTLLTLNAILPQMSFAMVWCRFCAQAMSQCSPLQQMAAS